MSPCTSTNVKYHNYDTTIKHHHIPNYTYKKLLISSKDKSSRFSIFIVVISIILPHIKHTFFSSSFLIIYV